MAVGAAGRLRSGPVALRLKGIDMRTSRATAIRYFEAPAAMDDVPPSFGKVRVRAFPILCERCRGRAGTMFVCCPDLWPDEVRIACKRCVAEFFSQGDHAGHN